MKLHIILIFLLFSNSYCSIYADRTQILLEAKKLYNQYEMRKNRSEAWKKRKQVLIEKFESRVLLDINSKDEALSKKAQKRKKEFYASLEKQDKELNQAVKTVKVKIRKIKKNFSFLYATPLTKEEIFGGVKPKIKDKHQKIKIIKSFLTAKKLFDKSLKRNDDLQTRKRKIQNIEKLSDKQRTILLKRVLKKIEKNYLDMEVNYERLVELAKRYKDRYGYSIKKKNVAKIILKNILASS